MEFFQKFFGYVHDSNGNYVPYFDSLGKGSFSDWRHFFWIGLSIALCFALYFLFKKYKKAGKITVYVLVILLLATRTINQTIRAIIGAEVPAWRAFPFHLCTTMTFLLPLTILFKWDKIKTPIFVLSMMGGIITIIIGDYFDSLFMTFSTIEGITAHTILLIVPIIEIAIGEFKLEFKNSWQVIVGILTLIVWATLANDVFFRNYNTNYMYLKRNGLPGNLGGDYYFFIYIAIFMVMWGLIFGLPELHRHIRNKKSKSSIDTKNV